MRIKAGKYTLAVTMIVCGVLMIVNAFYGNGVFSDAWIYSPAALVLLGLEILALNLVFGAREGYKVEISVGTIILTVFVIALFTLWTNRVEIDEILFDDFFKILMLFAC